MIDIYIYIYMCIIYHTKHVYIQKYRPEVGVQGCDIARGPQYKYMYILMYMYLYCVASLS